MSARRVLLGSFCFLFLSFFIQSLVFAYNNKESKLTRVDVGVYDETNKANRYAVERKSIMIFKNLLYLMEKCDEYIELWSYRKDNVHLYLLSKVEIATFVKARRDVVKEIEAKIEFFDKKKCDYAEFLGKLYELAEPFIRRSYCLLSQQESNDLISQFVQHIDQVLPVHYSDSYFNDELKEINKVAPQCYPKSKFKRYALGAFGAIVTIILLYYCRKKIYNLSRNFLTNQVYKPLRNLHNCLFRSSDDYDFLDMSVEEMLRDLEAQKEVLRSKIKDLVKAIDPQVEREFLDGLIEQAKSGGLEAFVAKCIKKAKDSPVSESLKESKPGWIEWFLLGSRVRDALGMSPREKLLELEIKGLLSRLVATQLLVEAKDAIDSNKLNMILGSLLPAVLATVGSYKLLYKVYAWYKEIPKKKRMIHAFMFHISDIINRNIDKQKMGYQDQGHICYLTHRFQDCLSVVPDAIKKSFERDLYYISSCKNPVDKKMQILQSMKIMLYNC